MDPFDYIPPSLEGIAENQREYVRFCLQIMNRRLDEATHDKDIATITEVVESIKRLGV